ncbi:uncharacterized protein DS421_12g366680 [Arachis hypogaea]|nr:uncharacterized protein DS421_12g366680 [Arachis hypogaea]
MPGGRRGASTSFDFELERTFLRLRREARGKGVTGEEKMEEDLDLIMDDEMQHHYGKGAGNHAPPPVRRVLGSFINPNLGNCGSNIFTPNVHVNNFELKSQLITLVQNNCQFRGVQEDPNEHLSTFLRISDTVKINGVHQDTYRLLLFPFSLRDKAYKWLESFSKESLTAWDDVVNKFLIKFYLFQRIIRCKHSSNWMERHCMKLKKGTKT